ncbi:MAG: GTP cyclohydrolase FolE2 [candidate division KSB1 bacterium]|nr:GTP cyclohydrolase FolE2 [candidate division KSB1 bacterium]MDZ7334526.1 GTP cyclohydrolase FolE2 [candidate division KSB1 bacterium]MDZ7356973.1 GTP cyclohydrolase FolE2 [candidate division KSB1 bacterium]MDZ7376851.1 GTP cyclohydrolase FolE2 [candidate division KSB1 bacterium]MDZ7400965.1 GTP cyclohydrolase FolE2 [candidate division KSB1 bacterium]
MRDVQNDFDYRNIEINKVGVKNLKYPIVLLDKANDRQHTVATINMYVNLPHQFRGTHMSRFIEILNKYRREIDIHNMGAIMKEMKERLHAESAHLEIAFPYFIEKSAPVSGAKSLMGYQCQLIGELNHRIKLSLGIEIPIQTVCPCSKEISERGAHNQRGVIRVLLQFKGFLWIEDVIEMLENCASGTVYSLLKREDEKFITERSYDNPAFVEDVVRNVALKLEQVDNISSYQVEVETCESIHNHDAYACIIKE